MRETQYSVLKTCTFLVPLGLRLRIIPSDEPIILPLENTLGFLWEVIVLCLMSTNPESLINFSTMHCCMNASMNALLHECKYAAG